jgi:hypothetical protein
MNYIRQGDVLLIPATIPSGAKPARNVVAEGEISGHHHIIRNGDVMEAGGDLYVEAGPTTTLRHEDTNQKLVGQHWPDADHRPLVVPQGTWMVKLQRQWDYSVPYANSSPIRVID